MPGILPTLWRRLVRHETRVRLTPEAAAIMARHGIDRHDAAAVSAFVLHALERWKAHRPPGATWQPAHPTELIEVILIHYNALF